MRIACKIYHYVNDTIYDFIYGRTYISKRNFFKPLSDRVYPSHPTHIHILDDIVHYLKQNNITPTGILDVGCGHGRAVHYFARRFNCAVYGIEIIEKLAIRAAQYNYSAKNATLFIGDVIQRKLDYRFNVVFMFNPFPFEIFTKSITNIAKYNKYFHVILLNHNYHDQIIQKYNISHNEIHVMHCMKKLNCTIYFFDFRDSE